ncbi:putative exonuclease GOR [Plecturocebus cupreus]
MLRATAPCWFPPGHPEGQKVAEESAPSAPGLLLPSHQLAQNFGLWVPQMYHQASAFAVLQAEPQGKGPVMSPAWPQMSKEVCYLPEQRGSACCLLAAPRLTERSPSVRVSAARERKRMAHFPSPCVATGPTDAKRTLAVVSHNQRPKGSKVGRRSPKTHKGTGMASKTSTTVTPKQIVHRPSLQSLKKPIILQQSGCQVPTVIRRGFRQLFTKECLEFCAPSKRPMRRQRMRRSRAALYSRLEELLLTQDQLKENGYPFPHPARPGGAVLFTGQGKGPGDGDSSCRVCCRCGTKYLVSSSGRCVRDQVAKQHVRDGRKESLDGFVKTFRKECSRDAYPGIYALDCEMCYTTHGLELTRVTVADADTRVVYDTFVKPKHEIVDYNTRFSGVTEADVAKTSITLPQVQAFLLSLFSAQTIVIGHSLESDLLALKLIPGAVVDTAVLFLQDRGCPYKRSLRNLPADYLGLVTQDGQDGLSSSEDANACLQLAMWKVRERAQTQPCHSAASPAAPGLSLAPGLSRSVWSVPIANPAHLAANRGKLEEPEAGEGKNPD